MTARVRLLFALGAAALAYVGWQQSHAPNQEISLSQLPARFEAAVLAPEAPLGRYENFPFCTYDFTMTPEGNLIAGLPLRSRLAFYLKSLRPVHLELEVRFTANLNQPVDFLINDQAWQTTGVGGTWTKLQGEIPVQQLRLGRNQLSLKMNVGQGLEFRQFRVTTLEEDPALHSPPLPNAQECHLPWRGTLALAVESTGSSRLHFEAVDADLAPGTALPEKPRLSVAFQGPDLDWHREIAVGPGPVDLSLPRSPSGWGKLQLTALDGTAPLPGQLGLRLKEATLRVRRENPPAPVSALPKQPPGGSRPHVILYLIDTLRADHLGCYGRTPSPSPELDRFAREAVLFQDVSAQSGWTKPATASIMSSQWPWKHKVQDFADRVPAKLAWLPEVLQAGGYSTAGVVTNNLAGAEFGYNRGYDTFQVVPKGTSEVAHQLALQWLNQRPAQKPFFLYVHTIDPHSPYMHSKRYQGMSRAEAEPLDTEPRRLSEQAEVNRLRGEGDQDLQARLDQLISDYDHEISNNDKNFGLLMSWLKEHDLYENSLILVVSDHGEEFLEHGHVGHLNSLYQELLHVPLLIKFPGRASAGIRVSQTWQQIDLAPTILKACGLTPPESFQGQAYVPGQNPPPPRSALFSVQAGRAILPNQKQSSNPVFTSARGIRQGNWVYQRSAAGAAGHFEPEELYDLLADPTQQHNLAQTDPGRTLNHSLMLEPLFHYAVQPLPTSDESNRRLLELLRSLQYVH